MVCGADAALMMQLGCDGGECTQTNYGGLLLNPVFQCSLVLGSSW